MAYQFRVPLKNLCDNCRQIIKDRKKEFYRITHREFMAEYRKKNRAKLVKERIGRL